jgi:arylsulfatase A-like enzyme
MNIRKSRQLLLSATAALPVVASAQAEDRRPNIMVIMVDDMGYSDLGCFGGEIHTPNLDGLANNGMRFTQFFNAGRSCPSRAALMTGLYAQQAGIMAMGQSLNTECVTIPEVLKTAGYHTAMTGKWHLSLTQGIGNNADQMAWLSHQNTFNNRPFAPIETYPCNRGFDEHWGTIWGVVNHFDPFSLVHNEEPIYTDAIPSDFYSTDFITDKTIDLIDDLSAKEEPFFMYVAYNAPHWPLHAKPEDIKKYDGMYDEGWDVMREKRYARMVELGLISPEQTPVSRNESGRLWENETDKEFQAANMEVHAAMIDCVDQGVGRIIQKLKETGEYDNTIIIFSSDNGASSENYGIGEFDRHDRTRDGQMVTHDSRTPGDQLSYNYLGTGWAGAINTPFRYWKAESFHGGIAAPTIVHWPAGMKSGKGSIVNEPCHFIDIMPTCIALAGAEYPSTYNGHSIKPLAAEGRSLLPLISGEGEWNGERTLFWEHENGRAVRVGNWKMTSLRNGGWQLFDLSTDYSETNNVAAEYPDKVREMKTLWNNWAKSVGLKVEEEMADTEKELLFYYPFDGDLTDKSPNNYPLSSNGHSFAEGRFGQALSLNGNAQYLDFNTTGTVNTKDTQYTICAWVYDEETAVPTSGTAENGNFFRDEILVAQKDHNGTGRILLYTRLETPQSGGDTRMFFNNFLGNRHNPASDGSFRRGVWQHVGVVCNPVDRNVTYYIDGERDLTVATNAFEACQGGFRIGGHKNNKDYWHGKIDELYFFKGLLSAEEIRSIRDNTFFSTGIDKTGAADFRVVFDNTTRTLRAHDGSTLKSVALHSSTGQEIMSVRNKSHVSLGSLPKGVYIASVAGNTGENMSLKITL